MATLLTGLVVDSLINNYDKANEAMWRKEDLEHCRQERQWRIDDLQREREWRFQDIRANRIQRKIENEQRQAETRNDHLSAISEISAELSGFALVSIININLPKDIDLTLLWVYGVASALTICCMVLSLLACTFLMLAVTRYCVHELEFDVKQLEDGDIDTSHPFNRWWLAKCEEDWQVAYDLFRAGIVLFLVELAIVSWVQYNHYHITSISITLMALVGLMIWHSRIWSKWRYLMQRPDAEIIPDEKTPLLRKTYSRANSSMLRVSRKVVD